MQKILPSNYIIIDNRLYLHGRKMSHISGNEVLKCSVILLLSLIGSEQE